MQNRFILWLFLCFLSVGSAQQCDSSKHGAYVDSLGVLRWKATNEEVALFGVNYTIPFAHAYRAHKRIGVDLKQSIELDVQHLARLGFDAFRVHLWDREISDSTGNLLENEHLDLFDYLLAVLARYKIKSILTPIAWWGNGWPEPDEYTPGFSQRYSRLELITNARAKAASMKYLAQLLAHINPYTKFSYAADTSILALEIINEPTHPDNGDEVTTYINQMVNCIRAAGFHKPIFYNISQNWSDEQATAVTMANIDGVSFQWYPTDLVHGSMLKGNYLRNIDDYKIPAHNIPMLSRKAKMVYEFDMADVGGAYHYPAMARSFRTAGMQFATMFSYDPLQIAWANTEYPTHYLNLLYTPSKALSLMIAGKVFHRLPRNVSWGTFPTNTTFDAFRVSYEENLSEMNSDTEFYYSNTTATQPRNVAALRHIAGCGSSPIIRYNGTGAYFLDKKEEGIWSLEVFPDVVWLDDPFGRTSLSKQIAKLFFKERTIDIRLPEFGRDFYLLPLGSSYDPQKISDTGWSVKPGRYLVAKRTIAASQLQKYRTSEDTFLPAIYQPRQLSSNVYVVNGSQKITTGKNSFAFQFTVAAEHEIKNAFLFVRRLGWRGFARYTLEPLHGFTYVLRDTLPLMTAGILEYYVTVESNGARTTFPGNIAGSPTDWDFIGEEPWRMYIVDGSEKEISAFTAAENRRDIVFPHYDTSKRFTVDYRFGTHSNEVALVLHVEYRKDTDIPFGIQVNIRELVASIQDLLDEYHTISLKMRTQKDSTCRATILFIQRDGACFGASIIPPSSWETIDISLDELRPVESLILPDAYLLFLPKLWKGTTHDNQQRLDVKEIDFIQILLTPFSSLEPIGFEVVSINFKKSITSK